MNCYVIDIFQVFQTIISIIDVYSFINLDNKKDIISGFEAQIPEIIIKRYFIPLTYHVKLKFVILMQ